MAKLIVSAIALASIALAAAPANAQSRHYQGGDERSYNTIPLGNGFSRTTGSDGSSYNTIPLGNGFSRTTGTDGSGQSHSFTTIPLGNGYSRTTGR